MTEDLFTKIGSLEADLQPQQKKLADYFLSHLRELPFQTTSQISIGTGVSEPTIIRFVRLLGYKGFVDFRNQLQSKFKEEFLPSERFQKAIGVNKNIETIANLTPETSPKVAIWGHFICDMGPLSQTSLERPRTWSCTSGAEVIRQEDEVTEIHCSIVVEIASPRRHQ